MNTEKPESKANAMDSRKTVQHNLVSSTLAPDSGLGSLWPAAKAQWMSLD